jgi:hypothetical protein
MESRIPRSPFSLDALIAEAKRRARQRRLLVAVLLVAVAAVVAALMLGSSGGHSQSNSLSGPGSGSGSSDSVRVGALALTVPRGFHAEKIQCPIRHCRPSHGPIRVLVTNYPFTAASSQIYPANRVVLDLTYLGPGEIARTRPPLNLRKLHPMPHDVLGDGTAWNETVSGGGSTYSVWVFEGRKAAAADRASVLRALRSIHRAH